MSIFVFEELRFMSRSRTNKDFVKRMRNVLYSKFVMDNTKNDDFFGRKSRFTFVLPTVNCYEDPKKALILNELVDFFFQFVLEQLGVLNWWVSKQMGPKLYAMRTLHSGNSLFHATSLAIWGIQDMYCVLRRTVRNAMLIGCKAKDFKLRYDSDKVNQGHIPWEDVLEAVSISKTREDDLKKNFETDQLQDGVFSDMSSIHIFVLSYVLRRPIIVLSELNPFKDLDDGDTSPSTIKGIYLPLERDPDFCSFNPIFLGYSLHHFVPLVPMNNNKEYCNMHQKEFTLPVCTRSYKDIPIRFKDKGTFKMDQDTETKMMEKYLEITYNTSKNNNSDNLSLETGDNDLIERGRSRFKKKTASTENFESENKNTNNDDMAMLCRMSIKRPWVSNELVQNYLKDVSERYNTIKNDRPQYLKFLTSEILTS